MPAAIGHDRAIDESLPTWWYPVVVFIIQLQVGGPVAKLTEAD
jgi:hypothetical protein